MNNNKRLEELKNGEDALHLYSLTEDKEYEVIESWSKEDK